MIRHLPKAGFSVPQGQGGGSGGATTVFGPSDTYADLMSVPGTTAGELAFWGDLVMVWTTPPLDAAIVDTTGLPEGFWLPYFAGASDSLQLRAWSDGTEADDTELLARNTTVSVSTGSVYYSGTHQRLESLASAGGGFTWIGWAPGSPPLTTDTKVFVISEVRAEVVGTTSTNQTNKVGWFIGDGTNCARWEQRSSAAAGVAAQTLQAQHGTSWGTFGLPRAGGSSLPDLSSTPEFVMIADEGPDSSVVYRDTKVYAAERRTMGSSSAVRAAVSTGTTSPPTGNDATLDPSRQFIFTY